jgi:hypothetical protein
MGERMPTNPVTIKNMAMSPATHERLTRLGYKDESYDDILVRVVDYYEAHHAPLPRPEDGAKEQAAR